MNNQTLSRRQVLQVVFSTATLAVLPVPLVRTIAGATGTIIEHPFHKGLLGVPALHCPNCGMMVNKFARTRHSFSLEGKKHITCSIHCLADMIKKSGRKATNTSTALYLEPLKMIPADQALYIIGSNAKGTMTTRSKLGFADQKQADGFVKKHGGMITDFPDALRVATAELPQSYKQIETKRKKTGKIREPGPKARCRVCNMYPARYPNFHSQLKTSTGEVIHFCSSQCLINFLADQSAYTKEPITIQAVWVTLYQGGDWEYAHGLYYLTGSKIMGPMGPEALPFRLKTDAEALAKQQGGHVYGWDELSPQRLSNP